MWPTEWSGDRIIAAVIIGGCTLTAAGIKAYVELRGVRSGDGRHASVLKRVRRLMGAVIAGGGVVFAALLTGGFLHAPDATGLLRATAHSVTPTRARTSAPDRPAGTAGAADATTGERPVDGWLQTQGTTIYYRYAPYLPDACPGRTTAHGSWTADVERGASVRCLDEGWLAFDIRPLAERGLVVPNITYCVNFRDESGVWGRHAVLDAPGFAALAVSAARVPLGRAIGFRYLRAVPFDRVILTREPPRAAC